MTSLNISSLHRYPEEADAQTLRVAVLLDELDFPGVDQVCDPALQFPALSPRPASSWPSVRMVARAIFSLRLLPAPLLLSTRPRQQHVLLVQGFPCVQTLNCTRNILSCTLCSRIRARGTSWWS